MPRFGFNNGGTMRLFWVLMVFGVTACQGSLMKPRADSAYQSYSGDRLLDGFDDASRATEDRMIRQLFTVPVGGRETIEGIEVQVERGYDAASGYECRRVLLKQGQEERRLVCRKDGRVAVVNRI